MGRLVVEEFDTVREGYSFQGITTREGDNGRLWRGPLWSCTTCGGLLLGEEGCMQHDLWHQLQDRLITTVLAK